MMAKLATVGFLLLMLVASAAHAQELLGDPELRRASVTPEPPRAAADIMDGSRPWSETTTQQILMRELMQWLSGNMGLPIVGDLPRIAHAGPAAISKIRYRTLLAAQQAVAASAPQYVSQQTVAVYVDGERTIYLPSDFTGRTAEDLSVLVHELVHHIQNAAGLRHECPQAREKDAYLAQEQWLAQFKKSLASEFGIDPFTVLVNGLCGY
jgi:hypothetical protein